MFAEQRRAAILQEVNRTGGVGIAEIGRTLGVSGVTARRDIDELAGRGLIARVRGGAMPVTAVVPVTVPDPAVARAAAALARPAEAVGILAGPGTVLLAHELLAVPGLTVVTNSIPVADVFHPSGRPVVLIGGTRTASDALVGPVAQHTAARLNLDVLFLGVHGMTVRAGFTTPDPAEAGLARTLIRAARRVVVLAGHPAWGVAGGAVIAPLSGADVLVTDAELSGPARAAVRRLISLPHPAGARSQS